MIFVTVVAQLRASNTRWTELLSPIYRGRTPSSGSLWASAYFITNGLNNWMPTLYNRVYGLSLDQSLRAGTLTNVAQVVILLGCAFAIDRTGPPQVDDGLLHRGRGAAGGAGLVRVGIGHGRDRAGDPQLRHRRLGQRGALSLHAGDLSHPDASHRHRLGDLLAAAGVGRGAAARGIPGRHTAAPPPYS